MSTTKNDGGPAFPCKGVVGYRKYSNVSYSEGHPGEEKIGDIPGMSLRDYFAGQALAGMFSADHGNVLPADRAAHWAFQAADAMIVERNAKP